MIGERLGDYTIDAELGAGGMGTVYRAEGPEGTVALKLLHSHLAAIASSFSRYVREVEIGQRIDHPNVVGTLRDLLDDGDLLPEGLCRRIGLEIATALKDPQGEARARAWIALLSGTGAREAAADYEKTRDLMRIEERLEVSFVLWQALGNVAYLTEAKQALDFNVAHAPADTRQRMVERVPLHRAIETAWKERS